MAAKRPHVGPKTDRKFSIPVLVLVVTEHRYSIRCEALDEIGGPCMAAGGRRLHERGRHAMSPAATSVIGSGGGGGGGSGAGGTGVGTAGSGSGASSDS